MWLRAFLRDCRRSRLRPCRACLPDILASNRGRGVSSARAPPACHSTLRQDGENRTTSSARPGCLVPLSGTVEDPHRQRATRSPPAPSLAHQRPDGRYDITQESKWAGRARSPLGPTAPPDGIRAALARLCARLQAKSALACPGTRIPPANGRPTRPPGSRRRVEMPVAAIPTSCRHRHLAVSSGGTLSVWASFRPLGRWRLRWPARVWPPWRVEASVASKIVALAAAQPFTRSDQATDSWASGSSGGGRGPSCCWRTTPICRARSRQAPHRPAGTCGRRPAIDSAIDTGRRFDSAPSASWRRATAPDRTNCRRTRLRSLLRPRRTGRRPGS